MDTNFYDKVSTYDKIYIVCKCIFFLMLSTIIFLFTGGWLIAFEIFIASNFIDNSFEFNKNMLKNINVKTIITLVITTLFIRLIFFVYIYSELVYTSKVLDVIRGMNLFIIFELFMVLFYVPKFMFNEKQNITNAVKKSLILINYKIGLSMLITVAIFIVAVIFIIIFEGKMIGLISVLIFIFNLMTRAIFKNIVLGVNEVDNA